jgi:dipeptidyl-peptidase-2
MAIIQRFNLTDKNPVIAFGGSYGGILAAYMRFKYPNLVSGALAASAPIYLTSGLMPSTLFFQDVTADFDREPGCVKLVKNSFSAMNDAFQKQDYATLSSKFKLCKPISDPAGYNHLLLWMRNAFTIMAMVDYPYSASFLGIYLNPCKFSSAVSYNLLIFKATYQLGQYIMHVKT